MPAEAPLYLNPYEGLMPITLAAIKRDLWPGLLAIRGRYEPHPAEIWHNLFVQTPAAPHVWIPAPELTLPAVAAAGAAVAIVKNPLVTRRFWQGWLS